MVPWDLCHECFVFHPSLEGLLVPAMLPSLVVHPLLLVCCGGVAITLLMTNGITTILVIFLASFRAMVLRSSWAIRGGRGGLSVHDNRKNSDISVSSLPPIGIQLESLWTQIPERLFLHAHACFDFVVVLQRFQ